MFVDEKFRISSTPLITVWREPRFVVAALHGTIDDSASVAWRRAVDDEFAARGLPAYLAVDASDCGVTSSMASRLRTGSWGNAFKGKMAGGVVYLGPNTSVGFIARTILRAASLRHLDVINEPKAFEAALQAWRTSTDAEIAEKKAHPR